jgi:hypothetical protein
MDFRYWLRQKWYEYTAECEAYGQAPVLDPNQYFQMYKYWLKREFRHQYGKETKE